MCKWDVKRQSNNNILSKLVFVITIMQHLILKWLFILYRVSGFENAGYDDTFDDENEFYNQDTAEEDIHINMKGEDENNKFYLENDNKNTDYHLSNTPDNDSYDTKFWYFEIHSIFKFWYHWPK